MEFTIRGVHFHETQWSLTEAIAKVLHADEFWKYPDHESRSDNLKRLNFKVTLNMSSNGVRNNGTGTLIVPVRKAGIELLNWIDNGNKIKLNGRPIRITPKKGTPPKGTVEILEKTPYIDPNKDREKHQKNFELDVGLPVYTVQFGVLYRPVGEPRTGGRKFSHEWQQHTGSILGWLRFEYDHRLIRIVLGNRMTEEIGQHIVITFSNIEKVGIGHDWGTPYICFDLIAPPILQEENFNRTLTGNERKDTKKFRRRIGSLHPGHAVVAPYAHQLRITLDKTEEIYTFARLYKTSGLLRIAEVPIEARGEGFFNPRTLYEMRLWFKTLTWRIAFQLEALLHNGLLNSQELRGLQGPIERLCEQRPDVASDILRYFAEALPSSPSKESPAECFARICRRVVKPADIRPSPGMFLCHHITFTPTRMLLEGPFPTQSNRVIRRFPGHEGHFIRVDFRDEDRLQYRWDGDVDGTSFLKERVGGLLKGGFELAGRDFEFLAYSSSALRGHQVWFMNPFTDEKRGYINSEWIRRTLGDFAGVIRYPSKYAARMAQAFTATDPSNLHISRDQWKEVPDLGEKPYIFTDGVGSISPELGHRIWAELCKGRRDKGLNIVEPSAYQIRFLGYKGMVAVDPELQGIEMRLRPSMNKFSGNEDEGAEIEIARAFERPSTSYLNRALVMILEDLGVGLQAFVDLQNRAVAEARMMNDSIPQLSAFLKASGGLGSNYGLSSTMDRLGDLGMDLKSRNSAHVVDNPFLARVRQFAMNHVLRDIKHGARIALPNSHLLVGVVDEGPAYVAAGHKNVYVLPQGKIFACIQRREDEEPIYLERNCLVSRSPVVHPGDVQRVYAIGKPPADQLCLFRNMKNVVVFSSAGRDRSLPSQLGGGDLDGDLYDVNQEPAMMNFSPEAPASYVGDDPREVNHSGDSTVNDICDFVVEYINSDVLGLLSDRHITIADQSKHGTLDTACLDLAKLCSKAVDYPKNGVPVNIDHLPRWLIPYKPDWHKAEVESPRDADYYESSRALGHLYRAIKLDEAIPPSTRIPTPPLTDPISAMLKPLVKSAFERSNASYTDPDGNCSETRDLFARYSEEMRYISATHTISGDGSYLREEEIVVGAILAKCTQRRWRKDRTYRMNIHTSILVRDIQRDLLPELEKPTLGNLQSAWNAWDFSIRRDAEFGANSFGLIALGVIFDCLDKMLCLPVPVRPIQRKKPLRIYDLEEDSDSEREVGF